MIRRAAAFALLTALAASPAGAQAPRSEALQVGEGTQALHGTLLMPARRSRGAPVLILPGSGPTDRDGNSPMGVRAQPYRLLAEALAAEGIASLRIDKRGVAASAGAGGSEAELRIATYADDARSWAERLRRRTGARCVWLLGHSEGGLHALLAADRPAGICGLILVSSPGRRLGEVLREQLPAALAGTPLLPTALAMLAELEAGRPVPAETVPPPLMSLFRPSVQLFMISMLAIDPQERLRRFAGPVLIVHGSTDIQVGLADAQRLAAARRGVELAVIEGMNHVMKTAPADRQANAATYADPNLPLAPGLSSRIAAFVRRR
jgi:pimeloyl-ACP methyl ester carboxylesterase